MRQTACESHTDIFFFLIRKVCCDVQTKQDLKKQKIIIDWRCGGFTEGFYWFQLCRNLGGKGIVVGDTLLVVQKTFSRPEQTVIMAPGLNTGDVIRECRVKQERQRGVLHHNGCALRVQLVRTRAESDERKPRGSRGRRDDVWGKWLETSEPKGQSDPDLTSCWDHRGAWGKAVVFPFKKLHFLQLKSFILMLK